MSKTRYLTAREAAAQLGVKLPTLYAYVSRGLLRSEAGGASPRDRRYHAEDVARLSERQAQRRDPARAAAQALNWGTPVLESALTLITDTAVYYRGYEVTALAGQEQAEAVASLLWMGDLRTPVAALTRPWLQPERARFERRLAEARRYPVMEALHLALLWGAADDLAAYDLRPAAVAETGGRILRGLVSVAAGRPAEAGLAATLAAGWCPQRSAAAAGLFNAALILLADHELNLSAFTARCAASAGATPYRVVTAGLAALEGGRHGGSVPRAEALLAEVRTPGHARRVLRARLKRGEILPGFGHPLYPGGDPRAQALLPRVAAAFPRSPTRTLAQAVVEEAQAQAGESPNIDFALAVLARTLGLAEGLSLALFALGRTIGWVAHASEQYQSGQLIRPRAKYTGRMPPVTGGVSGD